jgi:hypothetical protein
MKKKIGMRRLISRLAALVIVCVLCILSVERVSAGLVSLQRLPDGSGFAVLSWTGHGGVQPTIGTIRGNVDRYQVKALGRVPSSTSLSTSSAVNIPGDITIAVVQGSLRDVPFKFSVQLSINPAIGNAGSALGSVTGTFDDRKVSARLTSPASGSPAEVDFYGTIGSQSVRGVIARPVHEHGLQVAKAKFTVSG